MTSSTQSSQAEQNPLGNRKNPGCSFLVCFEGRKELVMTQESGSCFRLLPHDEWAPPSSTLRAPFTPGQARTSPQELGFRSGKPDTRAASRAYRGTAPPAFLAHSAPRPERTTSARLPRAPAPSPEQGSKRASASGHPSKRYLQAEDVLAPPQGHGLPQDAGAVGRGRRKAAVLTHATLRAQRQGRLRSPAGGRVLTAAGRKRAGEGKGRGGHPLPAGAAQRLLQPPQRSTGAGPRGAGRRHGAGGKGLAARGRPVARAAAQRFPHGFPPPLRITRPPPARRRHGQRPALSPPQRACVAGAGPRVGSGAGAEQGPGRRAGGGRAGAGAEAERQDRLGWERPLRSWSRPALPGQH